MNEEAATTPGSTTPGAETPAATTPTASTPAAAGSAGLEVPGEPGVYWCARHKKTKTRLRCGRCETPICPRCTTYGPTGARCPACASHRGSHIYQITPAQYAAAVATALALGVVSGFIASLVGLFALFYAPVAGTLMGKAISAVTRHKRGPALAAIAAAGLVAGALLPALPQLLALLALSRAPAAAPPALLFSAGVSPLMLLVYLALAIPSVWWWLR